MHKIIPASFTLESITVNAIYVVQSRAIEAVGVR